MSTVLKFVLSYPKEIGLSLAIGAAVLLGLGYVSERDDRIAAEAVYEERTEDLRVLVAQRDSMARQIVVRDSLAREDSLRIVRLRAEADSARRVASEAADQASRQAIQSGRNLSSTLDSIAVVLPDLGRTARQQWDNYRAAEDAEDDAQEAELRAQEQITETFRQAARSWQQRHGAERELRIATERALDEARDALEAGAQTNESSILDHWTIKTAALAGAAIAGYRVGVR